MIANPMDPNSFIAEVLGDERRWMFEAHRNWLKELVGSERVVVAIPRRVGMRQVREAMDLYERISFGRRRWGKNEMLRRERERYLRRR